MKYRLFKQTAHRSIESSSADDDKTSRASNYVPLSNPSTDTTRARTSRLLIRPIDLFADDFSSRFERRVNKYSSILDLSLTDRRRRRRIELLRVHWTSKRSTLI